MNFRPLLAALLLAIGHPAGAAPTNDTANVGQLVERMQRSMAQRCAESTGGAASSASAPERDAPRDPLDHDLSCTCGPQALDVAFPATMRGDSTTFGAFMARMGGAMNVCFARSVRKLIDAPCNQGVDPFGHDKTSAAPLARAHCECARSALDEVAAGDALKGADEASARYAAGASEADRQPPPLRLLNDIEKTCAPQRAK
jgi:hypothetical protein